MASRTFSPFNKRSQVPIRRAATPAAGDAKGNRVDMPSTTRLVTLALSALALAGCRLVIETDATGAVTSASGGYDCDRSSCVFEITAEVTETFTATPAEGYRFVRWEGLCILSPLAVCNVTFGPLSEEFKEYEGDVTLRAEFERDNVLRTWYRDADGDHYGTPDDSLTRRRAPEGYVVNDQDCDDSDKRVRPWAWEVEDGKDNNCNGKIDEGFVDETWYRDADGDGFGDALDSQLAPRAPDGYVRNALDCDDSDELTHPRGLERADGRDNDCDGEVDEGGTRYYRDVDGDGFGTAQDSLLSLEPVTGYAAKDGDCDDSNADIFPGAEERFDSTDNDCDGAVDEGFTPRSYYRDSDGDGYGDPTDSVQAVEAPAGFVRNDSDNCPLHYNPSQADADGDGLGDACDAQNNLDLDNDGVIDTSDNCPDTYNPGQGDADGDGIGDACDTTDSGGDSGGSSGGGGGGGCGPSPEDQAMLDAVNAFRAGTRSCGANGTFGPAAALSWSCELATAARNHSIDMATNNFFSHTGSDGSSAGDRATRAGYVWSTWGENIAAGYPSVATVMQGWIDSPGHCANLMHPGFTNIGTSGHYDGGSAYGTYWTQVFGRPR